MGFSIKDALGGLGAVKLAEKLGIGGGDDSLKNLGAESVMPGGIASRVAGMKKGGKVSSSASRRADGIATKGKTRGRMV